VRNEGNGKMNHDAEYLINVCMMAMGIIADLSSWYDCADELI
jgi:hypothetical protein